MKIKYKLLALAEMVIIVSCIGYAGISSATTCTANTSPTADCSNLSITSSVGNITINNAITSPSSGSAGIFLNSSGAINTLQINSVGSVTGDVSGGSAIVVSGGASISNIVNNGTIQALGSGNDGIFLGSATIGTITNTGTFYGNEYGIYNNGATITTINNLTTSGSGISGGTAGIRNTGIITNFNNANPNLSYLGRLPTNYNIIITNVPTYGQMTVSSPISATNFGVYSGSVISTGAYTNVLRGITSSNLNSTTGTYQGLSWALTPGALTNSWDLTFSGTNTAVMSALNQTTAALQNAFTLQNTVLVNGFTYDCPVFDKNNVCVSVGGRYTTVNTDSVNSTGGLLIGAYRMNNQVRMGAYIDQNVSTNSTGIVKVSNASPMVGVFGVWNERLDGAGTELKVSAGYGQKNTTMTRQVVDGTEAGSGSSTLTSQGVQAIGKYGFAVTDKTIVSPYAGLRYTQNNMGGYTEESSATVTAPLSYSAVNTNATTVVAGLGANYKVVPAITLLASAGLENDLNTSNGNYTATGLYGLNSINFNSSPVRTRATASAGAYYDITKNQRLSLNYIFRQEQFQGVNTNAAFLTYAIGL
jgi:hypothetical protein